MRKAQAIPEVSGMWMALVFIVVVFMIILGAFAAFPGIGEWFENFFVMPVATSEDIYIARYSTNTLQCAINSVTRGEEWNNCFGEFESSGGGPSGLVVAGETYVEGGKVKNGAEIECFFPKDDIGRSDAIIEYEEDGWSDNICYAFRNGKWKWRKAPCENSDFKDINELLEATASKSKLKENNLDWVHNDIAKNLTANTGDYGSGLMLFTNILNSERAPISGEKTSDDNIRIHYVSEKSRETYGDKSKWFGDWSDIVEVDFNPPPYVIRPADIAIYNLAKMMDPDPAINREYCTITNFYLPQEVLGAEKYIAGYGDPKFLVYWQNFPPGEDAAWTSYATWMEHVGTVVLFALPVGKVIKGGKYLIKGAGKTVASTTKTALTSAGSSLVSKLTGKTAAKNVQYMLFDVSVSRAARIAAIAKAAGQGIFKELIWGAEKHYGVGLKPLLAVAGVATVASWVGAYKDSVNDKYIKKSESLVLDVPYLETETLALNELTQQPGMNALGYNTPIGLVQPVVLNREDLFETPSTFYLASPCHADLVIEGGEYVYCREYIYNSKDKTVVCNVIKKEDAMCLGEGGCKYLGTLWQGKKRQVKDIPKCGEVDVSKDALENNLLFKDNNDDFFYDEVIVSYLSGADVLKIIDSDYDGGFDKYEINNDGMTIVSGGRYGGEIDFESDGVFDATFLVDDSGGATVLEVRKNGEEDPFCTFTREGTGELEKTIFYASSDTKIEQLQFPKIDLERKTCHLYNPLTPPITIKASGLNFDTFESFSFILKDTDNDGYWDYYDGNLNSAPDFTLDGEFGSVMTQWCKIEGIKVSLENKNNYKDDRNFCYSKPQTGKRIAIFAGVIIADIVMTTFSAGLLTHVAVGFTGGMLYVASQQYEKWPGPSGL